MIQIVGMIELALVLLTLLQIRKLRKRQFALNLSILESGINQ